MKEITLTKRIKKSKNDFKVTLVDDEDYEILSKYFWCCRGGNYVVSRMGGGKLVRMHRLILKAPKNKVVDHIDGNPLNNQKSNLRIVTHKQNCQNRAKSKNTSSIYKGVCWDIDVKQWHLAINNTYGGYFKNERHAAMTYDIMAIELFGDFARLNFPNALHG